MKRPDWIAWSPAVVVAAALVLNGCARDRDEASPSPGAALPAATASDVDRTAEKLATVTLEVRGMT